MVNFWAAVLAGGVAFGVTMLELVTSKYPRTFDFVAKSKYLYWYCGIYGLIAFGATFGLESLMANDLVKIEGLGLGNPWVKALWVGIAAKALLHIRLFTVSSGSQSLPVGVETVVQLFEPWMLKGLDIDVFNAEMALISIRAAKYPNLDEVKKAIEKAIPGNFPKPERVAFMDDINAAESVEKAMELFLNYLGRSTFDRTFP